MGRTWARRQAGSRSAARRAEGRPAARRRTRPGPSLAGGEHRRPDRSGRRRHRSSLTKAPGSRPARGRGWAMTFAPSAPAARDSAQRRLGCEQGMNDGSDRHHAEARLILILFIVETRQRLGAGLSGRIIGCAASFSARGAADAGGCSESEDRERRQTGAENDRRPGRDWKDAARDRKDSVADNSAKAGRQRPASGRRKERRQRRRRDHADQVEGEFQAAAVRAADR